VCGNLTRCRDDYDDDNDYQERIISELEAIHSTLKSRSDFARLFWGVLVLSFLVGWFSAWLEDKGTDKLWYSVKYECAYKDVTVEKRPSDCNWLRVPLGDKGCRYKKVVTAFGAEQRRKLVEQATSLEEKRRYEQMPNSATISWEKESDE
jgi:hypothetical protein